MRKEVSSMTDAIFMQLNRETANMLWKKQFGNVQKVKDFAGREMAKAAYGDENSDYGWNLDHILPKSQGGKDAEYNLICCNIQTNLDKADRFPCFSTNNRKFEIVKVQNHYEIKEIKKAKNNQRIKTVSLYNADEGVRFFGHRQKMKRFNGMIHIYIEAVSDYAVLDFIYELFKDYDVSVFEAESGFSRENTNYRIDIAIHDLPTIGDTEAALNVCVVFNTWADMYFGAKGIIGGYTILFSMYNLKYESEDFWKRFSSQQANNGWSNVQFGSTVSAINMGLVINDLAYRNTDVEEEDIERSLSVGQDSFYVLGKEYHWDELSDDLKDRM